MSSLLSRNWCALAGGIFLLALAVTANAFAGILNGALLVLILEALTYVLVLIGALALLGGTFHLLMLGRSAANARPPGRLVGVKGTKMHLLAEGHSPEGTPTILWMSGSHDSGLALRHLHDRIRSRCRSILYDRAGSGFSDPGPFPRSVPRESEELAELLDSARETGPFIIAAHSLSGLLATYFAQEHPDKVAGLVLLDSAVPQIIDFPLNYKGPRAHGDSWRLPIAASLGLLWFIVPRFFPKKPGRSANDRLMISFQCQPKTHVGFISAIGWAHKHSNQLVRMPGALGSLPLLVVIPKVDQEKQVQELTPVLSEMSKAEVEAFVAMRVAAQHDTQLLSNQSELQYSPEGTGHNFPHEAPDFVVTTVLEWMPHAINPPLSQAGE